LTYLVREQVFLHN